jgi:hypothetical protein
MPEPECGDTAAVAEDGAAPAAATAPAKAMADSTKRNARKGAMSVTSADYGARIALTPLLSVNECVVSAKTQPRTSGE